MHSASVSKYAALMRLKIRRLDPTVPLPAYGTAEAAGFDLAAAHDTDVPPGKVVLVRTGLVIEVPTGHFLGIFARSSTPLKRGLMVANGVGVVDPDYSGPDDEVMIPVVNFTAAAVTITRGDRLAQGIILPAPRVVWDEVSDIRTVTRGGFGVTGN
jgi:dUTP pyrophosphatase